MSARGRPLRVIQWATGVVGRHAVAAIAARPELELVGARVYDEAKAGRDVGEICGIGPIGVIATTSSDEILALDADCVFYAAAGEMRPMGAIDDICLLLESGKNVVSTAVTGLIDPKSLGAAVCDRIEKACQIGNASLHGTGIEPGWVAEVLPLTMSGLFRIVAGRPAITVEHITRVGKGQAPHWPSGRGWKIRIEGEPSMVLEATIAVNGEDENDQGCLGTAMHAIHAIPHVCAAAPGIRTFLDLPIIAGRGAIGAMGG
jgi:hypothetical protein